MQDPATYQQQINPQFHEHEHLKCPRCDSSNTKFCYYNNYNLSQPRHFCKNCRRYWTKGGALRNIPVGGGSRKNAKRTPNPRRSASSPSSSSPSVPKPEPSGEYGLSAQEAYDQDRRVLDFGVGSFGSLLASSGQFGSLLEGLSPRGRGSTVQLGEFGESQNPNSESDAIRNPRVELQSSQNSESYLDGWPDLSMYTPGSTFQ